MQVLNPKLQMAAKGARPVAPPLMVRHHTAGKGGLQQTKSLLQKAGAAALLPTTVTALQSHVTKTASGTTPVVHREKRKYEALK